ncbi:MAG: outer membrane protein assembly factor BamB [Verrucomicrobiales bacterium]|jgi:outer membrane protein assembly factor BamB
MNGISPGLSRYTETLNFWRSRMNTYPITLSILCLLSALVSAADWPRFLGPGGGGVSAEAVPTEWSDTQHIAWKKDLPGPGNSSPVVSIGKLYLTCYSGYGTDRREPGDIAKLQRHLICFDAKSGEQLWERIVPSENEEDPYRGYITEHGYASSTPVADGEHVAVFYGKTGIVVYDVKGEERWRKNLGTGSSLKRWGSAASPIFYEDLVIVNAAEESGTLYAFKKATGEEVWKAEGAALPMTYGTPRMVAVGDRHSLILALPKEIWGMNPESGKLRWMCTTPYGGNISPSMAVGEGKAFAFGGFPQKGAVAIKLGGKGDVSDTHRIWDVKETPYVPTPVYVKGRLYWASRDSFAYCLDAETGKEVYKARLKSETDAPKFYASPVCINQKIYLVSRNAGTFILGTGTEFEQLGQNILHGDTSDFSGSPAVSAGRLYLRSNQSIYCIQ